MIISGVIRLGRFLDFAFLLVRLCAWLILLLLFAVVGRKGMILIYGVFVKGRRFVKPLLVSGSWPVSVFRSVLSPRLKTLVVAFAVLFADKS